MKRGYEGAASTSPGPPPSKLRSTSNGESEGLEDERTRSYARKVADHYSARTNQTLEEREGSPIIHLKKLNNWIKSVLVQLYARRGDAILDLACGKGGDLIKWDKAQIGYYVGIDIAQGSIEDCRTRYNGNADQTVRRKRFTFPARLICGDCYEARLDNVLKDDAPFDICSCQFALHYSWSTEARARRALANVSALLRPGGTFIGTMPDANVIIKRLREAEGLTFGNSIYWISFDEEYAQKICQLAHGPSLLSACFGLEYFYHGPGSVPDLVCPDTGSSHYFLQNLVSFQGGLNEHGQALSRPNFKELVQPTDLGLKFLAHHWLNWSLILQRQSGANPSSDTLQNRP